LKNLHVGGETITTSLTIKREHPFHELRSLLEHIEERKNPFHGSKHLLIFPDNISINNAKSYVSKEKSDANNQLMSTTFENLAIKVIQKKENHSPTILENHYLRVFVYQYIIDTKGTADISRKIYRIIEKSEHPERTPIIEDIVREFLDYLRTVYPPSLNDSSIEDFHEKLLDIAENTDIHEYEREKSVEILNYFRDMEIYIREEMGKHFDKKYYLTRLHLVGKAAEIIKQDKTILNEILENVDSIRIMAISIFDATVVELLKQLCDYHDNVILITGKGTHSRIEKRFGNIIDNVKVENNPKEIESGDVEKWELPNPRMEVEFVGSLMESQNDIENSIVIARESSLYLPYAKEVLRDFGLPSHVQTRRNLSLSVPFRLVASLLNLLSKEEWTVEDISNPLRLGFSFFHYEGSKKEVGVLSDRLFLEAEYWLNNYLRRGETSLTPDEWEKRTKHNTNYYVRQIIKWEGDVTDDNIAKKLKKEIGKFQKFACHVNRKREARNGLSEKEYNRALITKTHITGDAQRVIGLIERADEFSVFIANMEGTSVREIRHLIKAFWIVGGGDTYGTPRRDMHAVKFVDAANSFFLPQKTRIILGMRSDTFPRKPPEGKFIPTSFREKVNDEYGQFYLQDPRTDYENEEDFFEATKGPNLDDKKIYHLNPYLDDRGHKNNWSVFSTDDEPFHVRPADFYLEKPTKEGIPQKSRNLLSSKPKSRWQKAIDTYRRDENLQKEDLPDYFDGKEKMLMMDCVTPRISKYEKRIATNNPKITPPNPKEETYLSEMLEDQKTQPVPAHEIDLWIDCPIKYYFYRYVFSQSYWKKDLGEFERGSRLFIPEYWDDFKFGSVPHVLMRAYFSSRGHKFISNTIEPYVSGITSDIEKIKKQLDEYKCYNITKENLEKFLKLVVEKGNLIQLGQNGVWRHEVSSSLELIRPPVIKFTDKNNAPGSKKLNYVSLARYRYYGITIQNCSFCFGNWLPKEERYNHGSLYSLLSNKKKPENIKSLPLRNIFYKHDLFQKVNAGTWENTVLNDLILEIKELEKIEGDRGLKISWKERKCERCEYRRLCGDWEVLE